MRQVFVAGGDHAAHARFLGLFGKRADDIIGFNAFHLDQRETHHAHEVENRLYLAAQVAGHWRAGGLVLVVNLVAEGFSWRIEHHGHVFRVVFLQQAAQHVGHAEDGAGGLTSRVGQLGQAVEGAVEVGRAVYQVENLVLWGFVIHRKRRLPWCLLNWCVVYRTQRKPR